MDFMSGSQLIGHNGEIAGIAFSADGSKAVSGAHTSQLPGEAILWNRIYANATMGMIGGQNPQNVAGFFTKTEKSKKCASHGWQNTGSSLKSTTEL